MILLLQQQIFLFKAQRIRAVTSHILQLRYILFCLYFRSKWPMLHTFVLSQKSIKVSEKKSWNKKTFFFCKKASVLHYFFIHMSRVFVNSKTSPTRMHFLYHSPFVSFRPTSSQMSTFNFYYFLCNEFPTFFKNAIN